MSKRVQIRNLRATFSIKVLKSLSSSNLNRDSNNKVMSLKGSNSIWRMQLSQDRILKSTKRVSSNSNNKKSQSMTSLIILKSQLLLKFINLNRQERKVPQLS